MIAVLLDSLEVKCGSKGFNDGRFGAKSDLEGSMRNEGDPNSSELEGASGGVRVKVEEAKSGGVKAGKVKLDKAGYGRAKPGGSKFGRTDSSGADASRAKASRVVFDGSKVGGANANGSVSGWANGSMVES